MDLILNASLDSIENSASVLVIFDVVDHHSGFKDLTCCGQMIRINVQVIFLDQNSDGQKNN